MEIEKKVKKAEALKIYEGESPDGKAALEKVFGKNFFEKDVTERIFTIEDVFKETGENPDDYKVAATDNKNVISGNAMALWLLIVYCFNGCQDADWENGENKYFPYAKYSSGGVWLYYDYDDWASDTLAGARLGFINSDHVKICVERFPDIYKKAYQLI